MSIAVASLGERLIEQAAAHSTVIAANLREHGDAPLSELFRTLRSDHGPSLQKQDDLFDAIRTQAECYYGTEAAHDAVATLRAESILTTSNHFGIDTLAVSVQCSLLFALRPPTGGPTRTIVVLGCGSVSMDSVSYPMGLLIYDHRIGGSARLSHRLPVLPNRLRRRTVGSVGPFDGQMVGRARDRLRALGKSGAISSFCERAASQVLDEDLGDPRVLSLPTYGHQATTVNARLWSRLVDARPPSVRVVQLELEQVTTALLGRDLYDRASLLHRILFNAPVRARLLAALDGARACWRLDGLRTGLRHPDRDVPPSDGTVFFWGLSEGGKRIPLLVEERGSATVLIGVDDRGHRREWEFSPESLDAALTQGELIPSLVTCFTVIAFARGVSCVGGPHQAGYLPLMQHGIVQAIDDPVAAELVARVPTRLSLADMNVAMRVTPDGRGLPAGPLEVAGAGGFTEADLASVATSITVREAYLAAFPDVLGDIVRDGLPEGWFDGLVAENASGCPNIIRLRGDGPASR